MDTNNDNNNRQLITPTIDFLAPSDRFASSSRLHGRLQRYQLLLRKFWWVIALIFIFVLGPVCLITAEMAPAYKSKARMWLTGRLNINESRLYTEEVIDYLATQVELLQSRTVQQRALEKLRTMSTNDFPGVTIFNRK